MKKVSYPTASQWDELLSRPVSSLENMEKKVLPIMQAVADDGDAALRLFSKKFDGVELDTFAVTEDEIQQAVIAVADDLKTAIQIASDNIEKFHKSQQHEEPVVETQPGVICWRKSVAIDKVGLYIPGGTAPLFSTVLMLAIPARLAGCQEIILCTPPNQQGDIHPAILYAAHLTGVHKIYKVGGAQAIAAMTFGTETIPKVYKVLGPGNQYVMAAKQIALRHGVAIDMPAGPSEVAVIADKTAEASFVAADLLSQAEHGIDSQVILFSDDEALINKVEQE
ncbi:MAG TPA: histidinol dehydrogenase, partial [Chitinophagales bacterium]|nr:histidinol dehydrogenase [Chitinophagales bacterium]